ncbi:hypothetical protein TH63_16430 [Rufibacter radiotolerans]|uniref:DUF6089 domain-containing protein n=1 Tax=Rufibacter radiotolerans TaxID=1379910 RepID=A0A0H4VSC5_9BACT|nr:DUF6089 family protein [Rufibacter radiotolerans]AKQ46857.1 hypothetical protein TH63_16430 [Rufibacter radiotolerans]
MKKLFSTLFILFVLLTTVLSEAEAQRFNRRNLYNSVGISLNAMNYFGDITPESDFTSLRLNSTRPSVAVNFTHKFTPRIYGRAALSWGRITGDDSKSASPTESENEPRYKRNLSFRNDIKELNLVGIIDLFENRRSYLRRPDFTPYAFAGVAVFHHNPKAYYDGGAAGVPTGWYELQPLGTEGQYASGAGYPEPYKKVQFAIPFGLGVKYKLARSWDVAFEVTWRKTFTDYLDDVSTTYADKNDLLAMGGDNGRRAAVLSDRSAETGRYSTVTDANGLSRVEGYGRKGDQRGDASDDDWYITTGFTLNYILSPIGRGPKFR